MKLREAKKSDLEELAKVHCQAKHYAKTNQVLDAEGFDKQVGFSLDLMQEHVDDKDMLILLHENQESILGFVTFGLRNTQDKKHGYVYDLYVEPNSMGQGIGMALLKSAEEYVAFGQGKEMFLHVDEENGIARQFYENRNYERTGQDDVDNGVVVTIGYKKDLRPKKYER